jgi:hypothetical protein
MEAVPPTTPNRVVAQTALKQIAAVRLRVLPHDSLPQKGPALRKMGTSC